MSSSPLRHNYIHEIRNIHPLKNVSEKKQTMTAKKKQLLMKSESCKVDVFSNGIRQIHFANRQSGIDKANRDSFEFILFDNGIFNINKIHLSRTSQSQERKNMSKSYIPGDQRLIKSIFLFPTQTIVQCQYNMESKFHKQMIIYCPGEYLIINNFTNGRLDKQQFNFNLKDLMLVKTKYDNDRLIHVKDYFLGDDDSYNVMIDQQTPKLKIKLEKYFRDKEFCKMVYRLTEAQFDWLEPIQTVSGETSYFGHLNKKQNLPEGLGLLINRKGFRQRLKSVSQRSNNGESHDSGLELYYGLFQYGLLNGIGAIWFQNKSTYFGQFDMGNAVGLGQFYSLQVHNRIQQSWECFQFKDNSRQIRRADFVRWIKQEYFNGKNTIGNQRNIAFIQNQYQKLLKIYAIPKRRELNIIEQVQYSDQIPQNLDENSKEIDDLIEEMNNVTTRNSRLKPQRKSQDITFNKSDDIKDIFQKIKSTNQISQKQPDTNNKKFNNDRVNSNHIPQHLRNNTSRSDDHTYNVFSNKNKQSLEVISKQQRTMRMTVQQLDDKGMREKEMPQFQFQSPNSNQMIGLGCQEVDQSYFQNRQPNVSYNNNNQKDFVQKEYAFQQPRRFKTPDYFIVENTKNHPKYDPSGLKSNLAPGELIKKNQYYSPSPLIKEKYLSPEQKPINKLSEKQSQKSVKKIQKTLITGKSKRIFYHPSSRTDH